MPEEYIDPKNLQARITMVADRKAMPDWKDRFKPLTHKAAEAILKMAHLKNHAICIQQNDEGYYIFACCTGSYFLSRERIADTLLMTITDPSQLLISITEDLQAQQGITEDDNAYPKRPHAS